jgi:hypothetical protein
MEITFTRTGGRRYATQAVRDDGVSVQVPSYDRTAPLPHDLAHYVVERELGLKNGFWGCVAAGALFPGMTVISGRQRPQAAARSAAVIREAGQHGTEAEVLVGVLLGIVHDGLEPGGAAARERLGRPGSRPGRRAARSRRRGLPRVRRPARSGGPLAGVARRRKLTVYWPGDAGSARRRR